MTDTRQFSLVMGGPFHRALGRLRLLDADLLPTHTAALSLALLAWVPFAALSFGDYLLNDTPESLSYFRDYMAYIRCLAAISIVVITERAAHL